MYIDVQSKLASDETIAAKLFSRISQTVYVTGFRRVASMSLPQWKCWSVRHCSH